MTKITIKTQEQADRLLNKLEDKISSAGDNCCCHLEMRRIVKDIYAYDNLGLDYADAPLTVEVESLHMIVFNQ